MADRILVLNAGSSSIRFGVFLADGPELVVEWKNTDFVAHTATADDRKSFETGRIDSGADEADHRQDEGPVPVLLQVSRGDEGDARGAVASPRRTAAALAR